MKVLRSCRDFHVVGRRGLEPRTYGLKVRSSTIELATLGLVEISVYNSVDIIQNLRARLLTCARLLSSPIGTELIALIRVWLSTQVDARGPIAVSEP